MTVLRGMHIPDTVYIPLNGKNIGNAEMNELSEIRLGGLLIDLKGWDQLWYYNKSNHEPRNQN